MTNNLLTVNIQDEYTLRTVEVNSGAIKTIRHCGGKIIQGPIITDNMVTITVLEPSGNKVGKIYKLPQLSLHKTFVAS